MPFLNLPCDAPFMHGLDVESNSLLDPFSDSRPRLGPASQHSPFTMSVVRGQAGPSYHSIMEGKKPMESPGARIFAGGSILRLQHRRNAAQNPGCRTVYRRDAQDPWPSRPFGAIPL